MAYILNLGSNVEGLALDEESDTIYYTDHTKQVIGKVDASLKSVQTVVHQGLFNPRGIALYKG